MGRAPPGLRGVHGLPGLRGPVGTLPLPAPDEQQDDDDEDEAEQDVGRDTRDVLHPVVGVTQEITEEAVRGSPEDRSRRVGGEKDAVGHGGHAGQSGYHGPEEGGEPADHDRYGAPAVELIERRTEEVLAVPEYADTEQAPSPVPPDQIADRVTGYGADDHHHDQGRDVDVAPGRRHAAHDHRGLSGKDEADQYRRLGEYQHPDQRADLPSVQVEDGVEQMADHGAARRPAGTGARRLAALNPTR